MRCVDMGLGFGGLVLAREETHGGQRTVECASKVNPGLLTKVVSSIEVCGAGRGGAQVRERVPEGQAQPVMANGGVEFQ